MFLVFILNLFFTTEAHASFIPYPNTSPTDQSELVMMGKGIRAKHTDQMLTLVCETQECDTLRYAIIEQKNFIFLGLQ